MRVTAIGGALVASLTVVGVAHGQSGVTPVGAEFEVTRFITDLHLRNVCSTPSGGFVVVRSQGSVKKSSVVVKRFDDRGLPIGGDFVVNTYAGGYAVEPEVACGSDGGFSVVWTDRVPLNIERDGVLDDDIFARSFGANGAALGEPFRVNAFTIGNQNAPGVCAQSNGQYAVIWHDRARDEIDTRRVATNAPTGNEVHVVDNPRPLMPPKVVCAPNGNYLALWGEFPSQELNDEVVGRMFSAAGPPLGGSFFVNTTTSGDQGYPVACMSPRSGFIVAWRDGRSVGGDGRIRARQIDFNGVGIGADFAISPLGRNRAQLTCGTSNHFVATTQAVDGGNETFYAQAVDGQGEFIGPEAIVQQGKATFDAAPPPITGDATGRFVIVWPEVSAGAQWLRGRFFRVEGVTTTTTTMPPAPVTCGDAIDDGVEGDVSILDALVVLQAAVGTAECELCRCDADNSGAVTVQDALLVLSFVADLPVVLDCPPCS